MSNIQGASGFNSLPLQQMMMAADAQRVQGVGATLNAAETPASVTPEQKALSRRFSLKGLLANILAKFQ